MMFNLNQFPTFVTVQLESFFSVVCNIFDNSTVGFSTSETFYSYDSQTEKIIQGPNVHELDFTLPLSVHGEILGSFHFSIDKDERNIKTLNALITGLQYELELELSKNEIRFLTTVLDNINDGIMACDQNGMLKVFNKRASAEHYDLMLRALNDEKLTAAEKNISRKTLYDNAGKDIGALVSMRDETNLMRQLEKVESRFRTIFEQSPLSIQIISKEGQTILVNPAWKKLWGISEEIIQNYILTDYKILEDATLEAQGVLKYIQQAFTGEVTRIPIIKYNPQNLGLGGTERSVEGWMYPLKDSENNIKEMVLIHIDVTEKEELLATLTLEKNRLDAVLRQLPAGVLVIDKKTNAFILTNGEMEKIEGRSPLGQVLTEFSFPLAFHKDGKKYDFTDWPLTKSLLNGETIDDEEILYQRHDGSQIQIRVSSAPVKDLEGNIAAAVLVASDITTITRSERIKEFLSGLSSILMKTLDYEETIHQIAISSVPELADGCIIDIIEEGKIKRLVTKHSSPELELLLQELQQKFSPTLDSPQPAAGVIRSGVPELFKILDQKIIRERTLSNEHAELIFRIGAKSHISVPIKIRGNVIGSISLLITSDRDNFDETDLATAVEVGRLASICIENSKLYRSSQDAIKQRDEFISIASHELKTPITSLKIQLQLADRLASSSESGFIEASYVKKLTTISNKQINRITLLVEDMLDISRISSGKLALNLTKTDVSQFVTEVLLRFESQLDALKIDFESHIEENIIAECDSFRIEQVLINLLTNAIRYGDNKPIKAILSKHRNTVRFQIIDQGPGIASKDLERIFERFERAISADNISGLGLGLFISRQIMEQHHGSLTVESTVGQGSIFTFQFPV
jgi:PAS domain S-box-containing protein